MYRSFEAGKEAWERYSDLVKSGGEAPFVRASSSQRVVDTATNWTAGTSHSVCLPCFYSLIILCDGLVFAAGFGNVSLASFAPTLSVVLSEDVRTFIYTPP